MSDSISVHDVASYILRSFDQPISTMKLQKLVFFSQGWSYGALGNALFPEKFENWTHGPVCRDLYNKHRGQYFVESWDGAPEKLNEIQRAIIDGVLTNYGALSGSDLSELTHESGTPWSMARDRNRLSPSDHGYSEITEEEMLAYFRPLFT